MKEGFLLHSHNLEIAILKSPGLSQMLEIKETLEGIVHPKIKTKLLTMAIDFHSMEVNSYVFIHLFLCAF